MQRLITIVLIFTSLTLSSQKFTSEEKTLILSGEVSTMLPIYNINNPLQKEVLLKTSQDICPTDKNLPILINRMQLSLASTRGGVGIAAPQVGINRNVILVKRFDKKGTPVEYFINPKITWRSELMQRGPEGDLSIDEFRDAFYRSYSIRIEYYDLKNKKQTEMVEGFTAVIFQHEIDHLFGILISDKAEKEKSKTYQEIKLYKN